MGKYRAMKYQSSGMNILICDDMREEALALEGAIKASGIDVHCVYFNTGAEALSHIQSGEKVDVCFLDILMPGMTGTELARKLRKAHYKGAIVFLTMSNEFAAESYTVKAHSYLLKPPNARKVSDVLHEIESIRNFSDADGIPIVTRALTRFLFFHEISHVEVIRNNVYFRLLDGDEVAWMFPYLYRPIFLFQIMKCALFWGTFWKTLWRRAGR
jgi:DNA-binding LytR/AlgR family response regulator